MAMSPAFIEATLAPETDEVLIVLLTITHPATADVARVSSDPTIRLSNDPLRYGTISRGEVYTFVPFELVLPDSQETAPPQARLILRNIDRELISLIRSHQEPAELLTEIVLASSPDTVERRYPSLDISHVEYTAEQATFDLHYKPLESEAFPTFAFTPDAAPGLFP